MTTPHIPGLNYVQLERPDLVDMDTATKAAFAKLGLEPMGGASGHGWSRHRDLQLCPRKFYLKHISPPEREPSPPAPALQIGSCFHTLMAVYYGRQIHLNDGVAIDDPKLMPEAGIVCDEILAAGADTTFVNEAWRLFEAYANYYERVGDYLVPLAVELLAKDRNGPNTCRFDLVARVEVDDAGVLPGLYVVEHKSSSRLDRGVQEGWHLDGEIIGQIMLWNRSGMAEQFGPLQGVIVNVCVKTTVPKFHREIVAPPDLHAERQYHHLKVWQAVENVYRATDTWPRALASCWGRYGACEFWDHCRET